jgi:archaetidylinositol phosphate synthase
MTSGQCGIDDIRRSNKGILEPLETPALRWLAARAPAWVTPDRLTGIGFFGALTVFVGYALAPLHPAMLWVTTVGLAANWLGDSLDGTLARFRGIERPRYGFYLDNSIDVLEQFLLALGLALSGVFEAKLALLTLIVFYMMSILTLIRASAGGEFTLSYFGFGPTELRAALAIINALVFFLPPQPIGALGAWSSYPNLLAIVWIGATLATFLFSMVKDLLTLAAEDPPRHRK